MFQICSSLDPFVFQFVSSLDPVFLYSGADLSDLGPLDPILNEFDLVLPPPPPKKKTILQSFVNNIDARPS